MELELPCGVVIGQTVLHNPSDESMTPRHFAARYTRAEHDTTHRRCVRTKPAAFVYTRRVPNR